MIFDKDAKTIQGRESLQQMMLGKMYPHLEQDEVAHFSYIIYKN